MQSDAGVYISQRGQTYSSKTPPSLFSSWMTATTLPVAAALTAMDRIDLVRYLPMDEVKYPLRLRAMGPEPTQSLGQSLCRSAHRRTHRGYSTSLRSLQRCRRSPARSAGRFESPPPALSTLSAFLGPQETTCTCPNMATAFSASRIQSKQSVAAGSEPVRSHKLLRLAAQHGDQFVDGQQMAALFR